MMGYPRIDRMVSSFERGLSVRSMAGDSIATVPLSGGHIGREFSPDAPDVVSVDSRHWGSGSRRPNGERFDNRPALSKFRRATHIHTVGRATTALFYMADNDRADSVYLASVDAAKPRAFFADAHEHGRGRKPSGRIVPLSVWPVDLSRAS
jgi:hypothetical protein